jgi:ATP-dependent RNA helicase DeaD
MPKDGMSFDRDHVIFRQATKMSDSNPSLSNFDDLSLPGPLLAALDEVGYEIPTPIQARTIPHLLKGLDLLGHAPTGTGKTAAFALPLLARTEVGHRLVQNMVLTPTRELAIQVAEAFQRYAAHIKGFHVLPVYGGQDYAGQIRQLKRGVHVVVGTPGRVMDHMRKGTLKLEGLRALVLDEADEMLRMGFIEDVEWILDQTPETRQTALFSATMPEEIRRIARRHLRDPQEIAIEARTATAETIRQRYWLVSGLHKLDALTRILEVEPFDALLMFVRTKIATTELANRLEARGYAAAALNGDMAQKMREQMVERLKQEAVKTNSEKLERLYRLCYGRPPTTSEINADLQFLDNQQVSINEHQAWRRLAHSFLISGEFLFQL